jgi:methionyl-tRNA formyltransferase
MNSATNWARPVQRVAFLGQGALAQNCLKVLANDMFREYLSVDLVSSNSAFFEEASRCEMIPTSCVFVSNQQRLVGLDALLETIGIDVIISVQHPWILDPNSIQAVRGQAFNLHNAPLPSYRGYNSLGHEILNGESRHQITIHWLTENVDEGPIAVTSQIQITKEQTADSLYREALAVVPSTFTTFLTLLLQGRLPRNEQQGPGRFYRKEELDPLLDLTGIHDEGIRDRTIRAGFFPPLSSAYSIENGVRILHFPVGVEYDDFSLACPANKPHWP